MDKHTTARTIEVLQPGDPRLWTQLYGAILEQALGEFLYGHEQEKNWKRICTMVQHWNVLPEPRLPLPPELSDQRIIIYAMKHGGLPNTKGF